MCFLHLLFAVYGLFLNFKSVSMANIVINPHEKNKG